MNGMFSFLHRHKDPTPSPFTVKEFAVLASALVVYLSVALATIGASSVWFDEAFGAYLIRFNFADVARYTASDVHPPLYYWALKLWSSWFGYNEVAMRSMSVVFGVIALVFGWLLVRRWFGRRVAATSLALMVITPFFIRYSQEMRMYTMVVAIGLAATYVLTLADKTRKSWQWAIYGLLVGIGLLTHYYAALIWVAHWAWRLLELRSSGLRGKAVWRAFFSRGWLYAHLIALALFAPWIGALISQFQDVQANGFWIPAVTISTPISFLTDTVVYLQEKSLVSWGAIVFGIYAVGLLLFVVTVYRRVGTIRKKYFLLVLLLATVPLLLLILASLPPLRPSFVDRYVTTSALAVSMIIGITIGLSRGFVSNRVRWSVFIATVALFGYGISNVYRLGNYNTDKSEANSTRQVVDEIRKREPNASIVADSPWIYYEAAFYSTAASPVSFIDANTEYKYGSLLMLKENDLGKIKDLTDFESTHATFWYVGRPGNNEETAPSANLKGVDSFRINDTLNGNPDYEAVKYQVL